MVTLNSPISNIKIKPKAIVNFKRPQYKAPANKPHKLYSYSPEPHVKVYCFRRNVDISKLVY